MRPYKGVETLLRAVSGQRSLSLTLVGSGPLKEHYQAFASSVGAVNALFTGRLSDAELRQAYRDHDVVVLPSTSKAEAFGLVLLEGMAHGCVPVASDLPGVREVAGPTGHVVPPKDASALRDCLLCLADHPTLVTDLQARSRQRASTMTWERVAAEYETVFRTAVGQPPGHATRVRRKPAASLLRARA